MKINIQENKKRESIQDIKLGDCFKYKDSTLYHVATTTPYLTTDMGRVSLVTFCINDSKLYYHYFSLDSYKEIGANRN